MKSKRKDNDKKKADLLNFIDVKRLQDTRIKEEQYFKEHYDC